MTDGLTTYIYIYFCLFLLFVYYNFIGMESLWT